MKKITLDASSWTTTLDFYHAIFAELGSPGWHGTNPNALTESMVWGEINKIEPPYKIEVVTTKGLPASTRVELDTIAKGIAMAREDFKRRRGEDVDVSFEIVS